MEREKFMLEATMEIRRILERKENGIMNIVQRAWAEGKRNAEVETLREAIDEALSKRETKTKPIENATYPTWKDYLLDIGVIPDDPIPPDYMQELISICVNKQIPGEIAEKLGIDPLETGDICD